MLSGLLLQRIKNFPDNAVSGINAFIIYLSLPACTLYYIPTLQFSWAWIYPILMAWIVFLGSMAFFTFVGKRLQLSKATIGCLVLTCGMCNTVFLGYPLIELFYGIEGLKIGIIVDQMSSFIVVSTIGVGAAATYATGSFNPTILTKKLFTFPPFLAFLLALCLTNFPLPEPVNVVLKRLADTLIPLALVSIGLQLKIKTSAANYKILGIGLLYKLFLAPLLLLLIYVGVFQANGLIIKVSILQGAMAPMVTGAILANEYKLNGPLASTILGIGIPISLASVYFWWRLLELILL